LVRNRFHWPNMTNDVESWVKQCLRCILRTGKAEREPLVDINSSQPLELVCMGYLTREASAGGYEHILVIIDHFTRYAQAILMKNRTA